MSQENVETLQAGFEAFRRGDIPFILDLAHDDVEWAPGILPVMGGRVIRGKAALERFFTRDLPEVFDDFEAEPLSFEDLGDSVLVRTRYSGRGDRSGVEANQEFFSVYAFRGAKIAWFRDFDTRPEALEAAGLSE